jgi:hypothetical protein
VALYQDDYARARALYEESLALKQELGDKHGSADSLASLGWAAIAAGDLSRAGELCRESMILFREVGDKEGIASCLEGLAGAASGSGTPLRAARLSGAAEALRRTIGSLLQPAARTIYDRAAATVRAQLGEAAFAVASAQGQAMSLEQVVGYALEAEGL